MLDESGFTDSPEQLAKNQLFVRDLPDSAFNTLKNEFSYNIPKIYEQQRFLETTLSGQEKLLEESNKTLIIKE